MEQTKTLLANPSYFEPEVKKKEMSTNDLVFAFIGTKLVFIEGSIPNNEDFQKLNLHPSYISYIGKIDSTNCFAIDLANESIPQATLTGVRQLYNCLAEHFLKAAIYAYQIILWNRKTTFCGSCGSLTEENLIGVLVKHCPQCQSEFYPKISPSVIVAVNKGDQLLLAQHQRITNGMYTVLAGFVNPGETLEECIHREIKEEAGIEVCNIRYFGSQPWPFPDSLMIGFTAEYASGELRPDRDEISDLKWVKANEIPEWPDKVSIARSLIDSFIKKNK